MDAKLANKIGDAVQKLMAEQFPEVGWMIVGVDNDSDDMLVTGNACVVCITRGIIQEIITGKIKHMDEHEFEFKNTNGDEVKH